MQYKGGNVPAHNEKAGSQAQKGGAVKIYITQVFRRQVQCIAPKYFGKTTVNGTEKNCPENKQHLVLAKVQQQQLYREGVVSFNQQ